MQRHAYVVVLNTFVTVLFAVLQRPFKFGIRRMPTERVLRLRPIKTNCVSELIVAFWNLRPPSRAARLYEEPANCSIRRLLATERNSPSEKNPCRALPASDRCRISGAAARCLRSIASSYAARSRLRPESCFAELEDRFPVGVLQPSWREFREDSSMTCVGPLSGT